MYSKKLKWQQALEILLLLHLFLETSIQGCSEKLIVVSGSKVSLRICNLPDKYKKLTWFYTDTQKIVEWESNTPEPHYFKSKFKDRVTFDHQDGTLHIYKVQKEDNSTYLLKILKEAGTEVERKIFLQVLDPVSKPVINIMKIKKVNNSCYLNLSCVAWGQSLNYTWYWDSGLSPKELQSSELVITVNPENYSKFYTCQVSNPVSNKNHTVYFTSACELAQSSGVAWITTWLVVMVCTGLGFLLT